MKTEVEQPLWVAAVRLQRLWWDVRLWKTILILENEAGCLEIDREGHFCLTYKGAMPKRIYPEGTKAQQIAFDEALHCMDVELTDFEEAVKEIYRRVPPYAYYFRIGLSTLYRCYRLFRGLHGKAAL